MLSISVEALVKISVVLATLVLLAVPGAALPAQITTAVVPPRPERPAADPVEERVRRTERLEARITEMREWVDSVAIELEAVPTVPDTLPPGDSRVQLRAEAPPRTVPAAREPPRPLPAPREPPRETAFREGAPAPATATPLPLLAMFGAASLAFGVLLRRRR